MADSGHPPAELHERLLICRTIKLNAGALGGHRRCCHAKMQKNAQNKPQIARLILCVHTTLQFYCNLFLTFCLALVNKMLAQVKEDPASVLALYNDVRRNITTNINTAMMVYLAQQASGMHFSGDIVNVPGTSVMGAQRHAEYQVDPDALLEMVLDIFYEPVDG